MADSPQSNSDGPVGIQIKSGGKNISDDVTVLSVHVHCEVGRIPEAVIVIADGSVAENEFPLTDGPDFKPGAEISVAGHYGERPPEDLFSGIVTAARLRVAGDSSPRLEVTCRDKTIKMTTVRRTTYHSEKTDEEVIGRIVGDAIGTASVETEAVTMQKRDQVQYDCSDWDFIRALADRNGMLLTVEAGRVTSAAPALTAQPVLTVTLGADVIGFDAEVAAQNQIAGASAAAWNPSTQDKVGQEALPPPPNPWGNQKMSSLAAAVGAPEPTIGTPLPIDESVLKAYSSARAARSNLAGIQGTCVFQGSGKAKPGKILEIKGLGDRFSGKAWITSVEHRIEPGVWETEVRLGQPETWRADSEAFGGPAASALTAPIHGLQIGKALQTQKDPDNQARIKIRLPMVGSEPAELWARYAQPYAGDEVGLMFLPEPDDEVVVAFLNADPSYPVILGSLHSAKNKRPDESTDRAAAKIIKSRSGLILRFDDDENKIIVEAPAKSTNNPSARNTVVIGDKEGSITLSDQHGNKIGMNSDGIFLDSASNVKIKAKEQVKIEVDGDVKWTSTDHGVRKGSDGSTG